MSDVYIYDTIDGGNIEIINGDITLGEGVASAVYLSLWGGNEDDPKLGDDLSHTWWGNGLETDPVYQYRSRTQYLLKSIPAVTANLARIKSAVELDLEWLADGGWIDNLIVDVGIPQINWVNIRIKCDILSIDYVYPWGVQ